MPTPAAVKAEETLIHVLWINAGLSCDGDSVALTAATQPSIEEIALGALPGLPQIAVHWPLIDFECGPDRRPGRLPRVVPQSRPRRAGTLRPRRRRLDPQREDQGRGLLVRLRQRSGDRAADHDVGMVGPAGTQGYGDRRCWHVRDVRRNPCHGRQPHRSYGCSRLSRLELEVEGRHTNRQRPWLPDPAGQPLRDTDLSAVYGDRPGTDDPARRCLRPTWLFGATVHEGCDRAGYYEQADFATEYGSPKCIVKLGCWGPVVKCNVPKRGWMNGVGGCPNVGGICIGCTMPGFPDKFMPFMDEPPGEQALHDGGQCLGRHLAPATRA